MTRAMADSVSQQGFYGQSNMHYMAAKAVITGQTVKTKSMMNI
jgi:predicted TIM-barrel enzyme